MDSRGFAIIGAGLAQGVEKASANLINIMKASHEMKQEDELLRLKKRALEKDIEMAPFEKELKQKEIESKTASIA